jgi:hypothetical protein
VNVKLRLSVVYGCLCLFTLPTINCEKRKPEDKIRRWATEVWTQEETPRPTLESLTLDGEDEALSLRPVDPDLPSEKRDPKKEDACERLMASACDALGVHTEECLEARSALPRHRDEEVKEGCLTLLQKYVTDSKISKVKACRMLENRVCKVFGSRSPECVYTRADMRRLGKAGNTMACFGDLLLWEARQIFSAIPSENGK